MKAFNDGKMQFAELPEDHLLNVIGLPNLGNGFSAETTNFVLKHRGVPRVDSRGKAFGESGAFSCTLMKNTELWSNEYGDDHFRSQQHFDNLTTYLATILFCLRGPSQCQVGVGVKKNKFASKRKFNSNHK